MTTFATPSAVSSGDMPAQVYVADQVTGSATSADAAAAKPMAKWKKWALRLGTAYFVFCFIKGLVWLALGAGAVFFWNARS